MALQSSTPTPRTGAKLENAESITGDTGSLWQPPYSARISIASMAWLWVAMGLGSTGPRRIESLAPDLLHDGARTNDPHLPVQASLCFGRKCETISLDNVSHKHAALVPSFAGPAG